MSDAIVYYFTMFDINKGENVRLKRPATHPDQRCCLEMKIQGYSYEETAARTGLSIDAVKSHLQNGRRMLWLKMKGTSPLR